MLTLSFRTALILVTVSALLPTALAVAFFDGPDWLLNHPFTDQIMKIATLACLASILLVILAGARAKVASPIRFLIDNVKRSPSLVLMPAFLIIIASYPSRVFSYLKDAIPNIVPFYLDPWLVTADKYLFFGTDPWRVSHGFFGAYGTIVIDKIYILWFSLIPLLAVWIVASRDRNFQIRGILTLFFIWIGLGTFAAMAMSSAGPVFYEEFFGNAYYAPLMAELRRADAISPLAMLPIADYLLEMRASGQLGTGISAMPSVHVAIAYFALLLVWDYFRKPWAVAVAGMFTFAIWIGSFHLAWHYAWDGIVSIVAVWAFWRLLGFIEIREDQATVELAAPEKAHPDGDHEGGG
ncbi:phosphatase PAP2 family protein [Altererythrobacter sp. MF3-039]|uniref:phosphatase PAP2 family protein n=1 Tax=Altererythrobacter sp. MF3-039 TaxID=3252901 RepID=UPI00390CCBD4